MNRSKWKGKKYSTKRWASKLSEEYWEVLDCLVKFEDKEALREELSHVEFIARCWGEQLEREAT